MPLVVSNGRVASAGARPFADDVVRPCRRATTETLGEILVGIARDECHFDLPKIDAEAWNDGIFHPIPPIIDAAVRLYSFIFFFFFFFFFLKKKKQGNRVVWLRSCGPPGIRMTRLSVSLPAYPVLARLLLVLMPSTTKSFETPRHSCRETDPWSRYFREALTRDDIRRPRGDGERRTRRAAETAVQSFIQSVHRFADEHYKDQAPTPAPRVIVFDEAQRAWDTKQNQRAKRPSVSEAHMMLDVMNRHKGWAVLVCLVGGGQEINRGEAGFWDWDAALGRLRRLAKVYASPEVLKDKSGGPFSLFQERRPTSNSNYGGGGVSSKGLQPFDTFKPRLPIGLMQFLVEARCLQGSPR